MPRFVFPVFAALPLLMLLGACAAAEPPAGGFHAVDASARDASAEARSESPPPSVPAASASAGEGEILVRERGCGRCHQSTNSADGVLSGAPPSRSGTGAYGANLTPDPETGIGGWSDAMIARAIREGLDDEGAPLCSAMPRYADLTDDEVDAIVSYLRGLDPVRHEVPRTGCGDGSTDDAGTGDADAADTGALQPVDCASYAPPTSAAECHACAGRPCQANGCFNGWWCALATRTCHPAPGGCAP